MSDDNQDFQQRLDSRFRAYAWIIILIATAVLVNQWGDDLTAWLQSMFGGHANSSY
jgi:hypothetical protein